MKIEDVILKKDNSILAKIIRGILLPFSWLYIFIHIIFFIPYKLGIRKQHKASLPIISVGNITMGGTGKTPFVITLTNIVKKLGYKPVIISRGYGRENTKETNLLFLPNSGLSAKDTGDEPQILSKALNVPIIIGKNRIKSLDYLKDIDANIIILDDGMQYWQLYKDIEINISEYSRPFGSDAVIPAGDLRESKKGLKRCPFIILTSNKTENNTNIEKVKKYSPKSHVYLGITKPLSIIYNKQEQNLDFLKGKDILAFSGIGNPQKFLDTLKELGANVTEFIKFPDHYNYTERDIKNIQNHKADLIVTTAKDYVKIDSSLDLAVVNIYTYIEEDFTKKLIEMLNSL